MASAWYNKGEILFLQNHIANAMDAFKKAYHLRTKTNNPICYECGLAYAIVKKDKDKLSDSASLVLDYLITGKTEKELIVKDERDDVFKKLLGGLKPSVQ